MKILLVKLLKFSLVLIVIYPLLVVAFFDFDASILTKNINYRIGSYGHLNTRLKEVKNTKNIDILFLGASHTYRGFDPRIFNKHGYQCFNLGSSAQTPIQTEVLLHRYIDHLKPKLIVFDVYPLIFNIDGVESASDLISNDKNDLQSVRMAFIENQLTVYNTLIYAFGQQIKQVHDTIHEKIKVKNDTYISGGFVESDLLYNKKWKLHQELKPLEFRNDQLAAFNRIIKLIKNKNIKLLLVQVPTSKKVFQSVSNMRYCDSLLSTYGNYINYNYLLNLNDSAHFSDPDHLNQQGVIIFNNFMISRKDLQL
jgi:hypothetical protein